MTFVSAQPSSSILDTLIAGGAAGTYFSGQTLSYSTPAGGGGSAATYGYNVKDYGAIGDGAHVSADTAAVNSILAILQTNSDFRGGTIKFPKGFYNFHNEIACSAYAAGSVHNIYFEGEGPINTILDFTACASGANGISFNKGGHFGIKNLEIYGAPENGVYVGKGNSGSNYSLQGNFENLRLQGCKTGFRSTNSYEMKASHIWSRDNDVNGFQFDGYHTSLNLNSLTADNNDIGFSFNGITYSNFSTLASDSNVQQGYVFSNITGCVANGIGAESNGKDGVLLTASNAAAVTVASANQDIHGFVINGLAGYNNSLGHSGTYAGLLCAAAINGRKIDFALNGASGLPNGASDVPCIYAATSSSTINCNQQVVNRTLFTAGDFTSTSTGGTVTVNNLDSVGASSGFPASTTWTPTFTGFTATVPTVTATYQKLGKLVHIYIHATTNGTSNATTFTIGNLPFANNGTAVKRPINCTDAGTQNEGMAEIANGSSTLTLTKGNATGGGGWTASGNKSAHVYLSYETA